MLNKNLVSVIVPSTHRLARLRCSLTTLRATAPEAEVVAVIEADPASADAVRREFPTVRVLERAGHKGAVVGWNEGAAVACGEAFVLGADDLVWLPGWLDVALAALATLPEGQGMVGLNDLMRSGRSFATHFLVTRRYAAQSWGGVLMTPHYRHGGDREATARARRDGRYVWAEAAQVDHQHHLAGKSADDRIYRMGRRWHEVDMETYRQRKAAGFPVDYEPYFGAEVK